MKKIQKENTYLVQLIEQLSKDPKPIWRRVAHLLGRSRRNRVEVNVSRLDTYGHEFILVPGKVLGSGGVGKKLHVAAFAFSEGARKQILSAGGKVLRIEELKQANPQGKGVALVI